MEEGDFKQGIDMTKSNQQEISAFIRASRSKGESSDKIAADLNELGFKTPKNKPWIRASVGNWVRSNNLPSRRHSSPKRKRRSTGASTPQARPTESKIPLIQAILRDRALADSNKLAMIKSYLSA